MPGWTDLTLVYTAYLAAIAWGIRCYHRARPWTAVAVVAATLLWWQWPAITTAPRVAARAAWIGIPGLVVFAAYRLSGIFFIAPMPALERALLALDRRWLGDSGLLAAYASAPWQLRALFELAYLLVYVLIPAGAAVVVLGGREPALPGYWNAVVAAHLGCYVWLPWLRCRPPRVLEPSGVLPRDEGLRRLNERVLSRGSIQANTLPSAHAAGAVAIALAVADAVPAAGLPFSVMAVLVALATVFGRYHYAADTLLGTSVGVAAWLVTRG